MIKLHSQVDLITNSSTSIYSCASERTIEKAKALVNAILAASGSDKTADDLYNFSLDWDEMTIERAYYKLAESPEKYGISPAIVDDDAALEKIAIERLNAGWIPGEEYGHINVKGLVVTDKDGNEVHDFMSFFYSIDNEAVYD